MSNSVKFLRRAAARVRGLAPVAPEIADRLAALAQELENEAETLEKKSSETPTGTPRS